MLSTPRIHAAEEKTFYVNSTADTVDDNPGGGVAGDSAGNTTLRAAIMEANALDSVDTIIIPAGIYTLSITGRDDNDSRAGHRSIARVFNNNQGNYHTLRL